MAASDASAADLANAEAVHRAALNANKAAVETYEAAVAFAHSVSNNPDYTFAKAAFETAKNAKNSCETAEATWNAANNAFQHALDAFKARGTFKRTL